MLVAQFVCNPICSGVEHFVSAAIGRYERVLSYASGHADDRLEGLALK